jgi:excisionase family DNA binding protein
MTKGKELTIDQWITAKQAGEHLGITSRHVKRLIQNGSLDGRMIAGALWLVNPDSLSRWTRKRRPKTKVGVQ